MTSLPVVSIIIPAYNAAKTLRMCLDSCVNQTYSNIEIVIINDGSIDDTLVIALEYRSKYSNVKLIDKVNEGLVTSRRVGVSLSDGKYILFLDADDYIDNNTVELLLEKAEDADMIIPNFIIENQLGNVISKTNNKLQYPYLKQDLYSAFLVKEVTPSLCGRLIRKEIFHYVALPQYYTTGEDCMANLQMIHAVDNLKVKLVDNIVYHYIQYTVSMINNKSNQDLKARLIYIHWVLEFFSKEYIKEQSLAIFVLTEYFAFLRDGGKPSLNRQLFNEIYEKYVKLKNLRNLPIWRSLILLSYKYTSFLAPYLISILDKVRDFRNH